MIVEYRTRQQAEQAENRGKLFKGRQLVLVWHKAGEDPEHEDLDEHEHDKDELDEHEASVAQTTNENTDNDEVYR